MAGKKAQRGGRRSAKQRARPPSCLRRRCLAAGSPATGSCLRTEHSARLPQVSECFRPRKIGRGGSMAPFPESGPSAPGRATPLAPATPPLPSARGWPNHSAAPSLQKLSSPGGCPRRRLHRVSLETPKLQEMEIHHRKASTSSRSEPNRAAAFQDGNGLLIESDETAVEETFLHFVDSEPEVVAFLRVLLLEGRKRPGDCGVSLDSKPSWVDDEKIRLGQQFAQKYFFGVMLAEMASLFLIFSVPGSLSPILFSGNTDTPLKAFHRYLTTVSRIRTWYSGDLWAEGGSARSNLVFVRSSHDRYRRLLNALNSAPAEERARRTALQESPWEEGTAAAVRQHFAARGAVVGDAICPLFNLISTHHEWINQLEMSITQFGFVALAVTYPELFGTSGASEEELAAFVHLWEVLGYLLGLEKRFNFCAGGLDAVRRRSKALVRSFYSPTMAHVDASWEHMTRCVVAGLRFYSPHLSYEVVLVHILRVFGGEPPRNVLHKLSARQRLQSRLLAWVLRWAPRIAPLRALLNWRLRTRIAHAQKRANDSQWLRERDARVGFASFQNKQEKGNKKITRRSIFGVSLCVAAPVSAVALVIATAALTRHDLVRYMSFRT